jgi:hypothetical protein
MLTKKTRKNTSLYFLFFFSSNLMERINYIHYLCYLAGMDILHCFRDLHCWSAQVSAILANFLDGELWNWNEYCSLWCHLLFFIVNVVY